jgi:hypothetical protein
VQERESGTSKVLVSVIAVGIVALVVAAVIRHRGGEPADELFPVVAVAVSGPPNESVEYCNHYAAEATRGLPPLVSGAPRDASEDGAREAAGGRRGTLVGLSAENGRTESARAAYRACMIREGYSS